MVPDLYPSIHQACRLFEVLHAPLHDGEQIELRWSSPYPGNLHSPLGRTLSLFLQKPPCSTF